MCLLYYIFYLFRVTTKLKCEPFRDPFLMYFSLPNVFQAHAAIKQALAQVSELKSRQQGIGAVRRASGSTAAGEAGQQEAEPVMEASDDAESAVQSTGIAEAMGVPSLESACSSGWDVLRQKVLGNGVNSVRQSIVL